MSQTLRQKTRLFLVACVFLGCFLLSWTFGGAKLYPWELLSSDTNEVSRHILLSIRLPRILSACLVGSAISVAGLLTQALFRNPLATPSVIGISSGASLGAVLAFFLGLSSLSLWVLPTFAALGSLLTTAFILTLSQHQRFRTVEDLLLIGFAMNAILNAIASFLLSLSLTDFDKAPMMMNWLLGTLSGKTWEHVYLGLWPLIIGLFVAIKLSKKLELLNLGHDVAQTLGIDLPSLKRKTIALVCLLEATAVSIGGVLPFLGLIVPHFTRLLMGNSSPYLWIATILNGMSLLLSADLVARTLIAPAEMQVGVLIAIFGSPCFLVLLYRNRKGLSQ